MSAKREQPDQDGIRPRAATPTEDDVEGHRAKAVPGEDTGADGLRRKNDSASDDSEGGEGFRK